MKKQFRITFSILALMISAGFHVLTGQAVSINTDGSAPDASAILDIKSMDKGFLVPRMSSAQRLLIGSPAEGLLVFDETTNSFWFYNSTSLGRSPVRKAC